MPELIDCFSKAGLPHLREKYQTMVASGMSEPEAANKILLEEHKRLQNELNAFKKSIKLPQDKYEPFDNSEKIKSLNESQDQTPEIPQQAEIKSSNDAEVNKIVGGAGEEPPNQPPIAESGSGDGESDIGGITHAANEVRRVDRKLPEYQKEPQSFEQWNDDAEKLIKSGYDVEKLMDRIEKGHDPTPVENAIRKIYIATIDAEIARNPTDELLAKQKRFIEIGDLSNSRAGRNLVSLKGDGSPLASISDFYVAKMEAVGADKLTEAQKEEVKKQWDEVQKADSDADAKLKMLEEENAKLKAQVELNKTKKQIQKPKEKKSHEDYVKERTSYREELKQAKEAHEKWLKDQGIQKQGFGFTLTGDMVKAVSKIVKSYAEEGIGELKEIVSKVYEDLKDIFPGLEEKDVLNVIAGEHNEKKPTRNELAAKMRDLKDEAYYINKLERLLAGTEPKEERKRVKRNIQITDLQNKIKDFRKAERDAAKEPKEEIPNEVKKLQSLKKRNETEFEKIKERISKGDFETKNKFHFWKTQNYKRNFQNSTRPRLMQFLKKKRQDMSLI
jgi:hypothetical protein